MTHQLPPNFFLCPPLSDEEHAHIKALAITTAMDIVEKTRLDNSGAIHWTLQSDEGELQIFRGVDPTSPPGSSLHCGYMQITGTLDEVMDLFRTDTPAQIERHTRRFAQDASDAITLYTIATRTHDTPHRRVNIKWQGFQSPLSLVRPRDNCVLECTHDFEWHGRRGWIRGWKSIKIACCPDLEASVGFVRMDNLGSGLVFLEATTATNQRLDLFNIGHADMRVGASEWYLDRLHTRQFLTDLMSRRRTRNIVDIQQYLREDRLAKLPCVDPSLFRSRHRATHCGHCDKRFFWSHRRVNCHKCGHVVCNLCHVHWDNLDVCLGCVSGVLTASWSAGDQGNDSTSSSSSHSSHRDHHPSVQPNQNRCHRSHSSGHGSSSRVATTHQRVHSATTTDNTLTKRLNGRDMVSS
ncbi:Aste57867_2512 [Aphanomyces stellatus]|uniref:Aste57867_2512 protein n=1 Tax=Aphanomyces stellatus TaxID=120398 RepID=A0A485K7Q7_9STRA|nr:hypothetical protein As57867_002505 [Aphanomyces stellatus]VFT79711.1 Aste57867_2512 [Aphanomyces stellatus]